MIHHVGISGTSANGTKFSAGKTVGQGPNGNYFKVGHEATYNPQTGKYQVGLEKDVYDPSDGASLSKNVEIMGQK